MVFAGVASKQDACWIKGIKEWSMVRICCLLLCTGYECSFANAKTDKIIISTTMAFTIAEGVCVCALVAFFPDNAQ